MRVHLGTDHAGFECKQAVARHLRAAGHEVIDHGADVYDPDDDYPGFCLACAEAVAGDPGSLGIVLGGSGNGEQMAANRVAGIRAALAWTVTTARLAREHNDANVLSIGARQYDVNTALSIVDAFLTTRFSGDERHVRRIGQLAEYERGSSS